MQSPSEHAGAPKRARLARRGEGRMPSSREGLWMARERDPAAQRGARVVVVFDDQVTGRRFFALSLRSKKGTRPPAREPAINTCGQRPLKWYGPLIPAFSHKRRRSKTDSRLPLRLHEHARVDEFSPRSDTARRTSAGRRSTPVPRPAPPWPPVQQNRAGYVCSCIQ